MEDKQVEINALYQDLIANSGDFTEKEIQKIKAAYQLYYQFKGQNSNDLKKHLTVALIIKKELSFPTSTIVPVFLYSVFENQKITQAEIIQKFGETEMQLIEELMKIFEVSKRNTTEEAIKGSLEIFSDKNWRVKYAKQTENYIQLFLTLATDVRAILIKLAFRLNRMRMIDVYSDEKKFSIAKETSILYAPIAHRLGLYNIKTELEERSMKYTNPQMYRFIAQKLNETKKGREKFIKDFIRPIKKEIERMGHICEIKGRPKSIFSIWNKMQKQNVEFEGIYDLFAIRIILKNDFDNKQQEKNACWQVYSMITNWYEPNPKRLRDWISSPKKSGYESLHTTVSSNGQWVEVQIRTERMDIIAEKGHAAHWKYKEAKAEKEDNTSWLAKMREVLENPTDEFKKDQKSKKELYSNEIIIFTPKGELKKVKRGTTVLDFAYMLHTQLGDKCIGAKIKNRAASISYELQNGDRVEILTSSKQTPKIEWLKIVKSNKAISKIKRSIKSENSIAEGKEQLRQKIKNLQLDFNEQIVTRVRQYFNYKTSFELYEALGTGNLDVSKIKRKILDDFYPQPQEKEQTNETPQSSEQEIITNSDEILIVNNKLDNIDYQLAKCCKPLPGDRIFAFTTVSKGIKVHSYNCPNAEDLLTRHPHRVLNAKWQTGKDKNVFFNSHLRIVGLNTAHITADIIDVVSRSTELKMQAFKIETKGNQFIAKLSVSVKEASAIDGLKRELRKIPEVTTIGRDSPKK